MVHHPHLPNGGFHTPSPTHLVIHHCLPAQWRFLYTIAHLPNGSFYTPSPTPLGGFRTPLRSHLTAVFVHHPHLPNGGFHVPSRTHLLAVFVHHRHPSHSAFCTASPTRRSVIFVHRRAPTPGRFLYTITHHHRGLLISHVAISIRPYWVRHFSSTVVLRTHPASARNILLYTLLADFPTEQSDEYLQKIWNFYYH